MLAVPVPDLSFFAKFLSDYITIACKSVIEYQSHKGIAWLRHIYGRERITDLSSAPNYVIFFAFSN